jgi:cytochrome bd-type quinol oxidase subunit 2
VTRKKPVTLLVFGILNLVFGILGLLMSLCCGLGIAAFLGMMVSISQQAPAQDQKELEDLWQVFTDNVPGLVPFFLCTFVVSFFLAVMQIVSGIGLIRIRSWGRWLCAMWAPLHVLTVMVSLIFQVVVFAPGLQKATEEFQRWAERKQQQDRQKGVNRGAPAPQFQTIGGTGNPIVDNAVTIATSGFSAVYAAVAFVFMILPQTGRAIARYYGREDRLEDGHDYYDDDYRRQRRGPEQFPEGGEPEQPSTH